MTLEQAQFLCDSLNYCGFQKDEEDVKPRKYSGRGMYGKETYAVNVDSLLDALSATVGYMKSLTESELRSLPQLDDLSQDSMGRGVILY